jgi:hypothetical protein
VSPSDLNRSYVASQTVSVFSVAIRISSLKLPH